MKCNEQEINFGLKCVASFMYVAIVPSRCAVIANRLNSAFFHYESVMCHIRRLNVLRDKHMADKPRDCRVSIARVVSDSWASQFHNIASSKYEL